MNSYLSQNSCIPVTPRTSFWLLVMFAIVLTQPNQALAFEASLKVSTSTNFDAPVQLAGANLVNQIQTRPMTVAPEPDAVAAVAAEPKPMIRLVARASVPAVMPQPPADKKLVMEGVASYYSREGCIGCNALRIMANGQPLDDGALTMAIGADKKHLVGYHARITNLATGLAAVVKITDTGGFYADKYGNRVADLSVASKQAIGMKGGLGKVRVEVF